MVTLTFHGGVGEIGGNKILLEDGDSRILLDFGMNFVERSKFYSEPWLSPRDERGLLEFGLLPEVPGLYKFDEKEPEIDAVFLSHSHTDHTAYISFLNRKIPSRLRRNNRTHSSSLQRNQPQKLRQRY